MNEIKHIKVAWLCAHSFVKILFPLSAVFELREEKYIFYKLLSK